MIKRKTPSPLQILIGYDTSFFNNKMIARMLKTNHMKYKKLILTYNSSICNTRMT